MDINAGNINALTAVVSTAFNKYLTTGPSLYERFSMTVPSTAGENFYPRLGELPGMRKWYGNRLVNMLSVSGYSIANETYEETIGIRREDLEDDRFGVLTPFIEQLGQDAGELPDQLCFNTLQNGVSLTGFDGQYLFDSDHPAVNSSKADFSYSNIGTPQTGETAGPRWYLLCTKRPLKPIIFQPRRAFTVTARTQLTSDNVFHENRFEWGVDGRCAAGVGLWELAYMSYRPLTQQSFADAKAAMSSLCRADGTPYGIVPDLLVVPSNLEQSARYLLKSQFVPTVQNGAQGTAANPWIDAADMMVAPRLSQAAYGG